MRTPRFYQDIPLQLDCVIDFDDGAVQHIARVLRMQVDQTICLFNGDDHEYMALLTRVEKRSVSAKIISKSSPNRRSALKVEIGQSLSKGDRMDYAVQKSTELGMHSLTPLISERSEVRLKADRLQKKQQQWQQLATSACEQSLRTDVPTIHDPCSLSHWITNCEAQVKLVLHHHSATPLTEIAKPTSVALLIGPEGGLSEAEVEQAKAAGFIPVAFGPRVMRTETAPIAAQAILQYMWGDLN